jgi:hypothetical protein
MDNVVPLIIPRVRLFPIKINNSVTANVPIDTVKAVVKGDIPLSCLDEVEIKAVLLQWSRWVDDVE